MREEEGEGGEGTTKQTGRDEERQTDGWSSLGPRRGGSALSGDLRELLIHKADLVVIHKTDLVVDPCLSPPTCAEKSDKEADLWVFAGCCAVFSSQQSRFTIFQALFAPE